MKILQTEDEQGFIIGVLRMIEDIKGDLAEVGCYEGGSANIIKREMPNRTLHLFDTWSGFLTEQVRKEPNYKPGDLLCHLREIRSFLSKYDKVIFHQGDIVETCYEVKDKRFALVHIDVDIYIPTMAALEFFYSRVNKDGIILIDDYIHETVKKAVDKFFENKKEKVKKGACRQVFIKKL